jgi:hypothetical protein
VGHQAPDLDLDLCQIRAIAAITRSCTLPCRATAPEIQSQPISGCLVIRSCVALNWYQAECQPLLYFMGVLVRRCSGRYGQAL